MFKIILVDDNPEDLNGLIYFVPWKDFNCTVVATASNGAEGIEAAKNYNPDIIITDISMPHIDGISMTEEILSFLPDVHFIYTSCFNDFDFAQRAMKLGVSSYITKPIDIDELTESIIRIVSECEEDTRRNILEYDLRRQLNEHRGDLTKLFFTDLLFGISADSSALKYRARYLDISEDAPLRLVIFQADHDYGDNVDKQYLHSQYLKKLLEEEFLSVYTGYSLRYEISSVIIILQDSTDDGELLALLEKVQDTFFKDTDRTVTICLDNPYPLSMLPTSFRKLLETLKNESFIKNGKIFTATDIELCSENTELSSFDEIYSDIQDIFHGLKAPVDFIAKYYPDSGKITEFQAKILSFYVLYSIHLYLSEQNKNLHELFGENFNLLERLDHYRSIHNLKQWIENILTMTRDSLNNTEISNSQLIVAKIKEHINNNFATIQGLDQAIAPLYISLSHARRLFKQVTGETIFIFLLKVRMEHAKEYLENKQYKIYEVGQMVGYPNTSYFTSAFRQYTGLSPQEYRHRKSLH